MRCNQQQAGVDGCIAGDQETEQLNIIVDPNYQRMRPSGYYLNFHFHRYFHRKSSSYAAFARRLRAKRVTVGCLGELCGIALHIN
jgi:hypothetical protein